MTLSKLSLSLGTRPDTHSSQTGTHSTPHGALTISQPESLKAVARLVESTPDRTDKALVSSLKQQNILLEERSDWRFPNDREPYQIFHGYNVSGNTEDKDNMIAAQRKLLLAMQPMPVEDMSKSLLTVMMLMVKPSGETAKDASDRCTLYALQMRDWPADIFIKVLDIISKTATFWPAFSEFNSHYEQLIRKRKKMLETLQKCTMSIE